MRERTVPEESATASAMAAPASRPTCALSAHSAPERCSASPTTPTPPRKAPETSSVAPWNTASRDTAGLRAAAGSSFQRRSRRAATTSSGRASAARPARAPSSPVENVPDSTASA